MKLSYFELISPSPFKIKHVGTIKKTQLKDIEIISFQTYQIYLSIISMTTERFYENYPQSDISQIQNSQSIFDLMTSVDELRSLLLEALNFFFIEEIQYDSTIDSFITYQNDQPIGLISSKYWPDIRKVIAQIHHVTIDEDIQSIKNTKAKKIMEKIQKGRKKLQAAKSTDKNRSMENVISVLACYAYNINYINIWELTVYQLWDQFERFQINEVYTLMSMNTAIYGNEKNAFDIYQRINILDK